MQLIFTVPDASAVRVIDAINGLFPVPRDKNGNALFTEPQWVKEKLRLLIIELVHRYELRTAIYTAKSGISLDNDLVN